MMTLLTVCAVNYVVVYGLGLQSEPSDLVNHSAYLLACYLGGRLLLNSESLGLICRDFSYRPTWFVTYGFIGGSESLLNASTPHDDVECFCNRYFPSA